MRPKLPLLVTPLLVAGSVHAASVTWHAMAESLDAPPFGYQMSEMGEPRTYRGQSAQRNRLVQCVSVEGLGTKAEVASTSDYYVSAERGFLGLFREQASGEERVTTEAWVEPDGLHLTKRSAGGKDRFERTYPLAPDVLFATGPDFLYPMVKGASGTVRFRLFDFERLGLLVVSARPAGSRRVRLPAGEFETRVYEVEFADAAGGARSGGQLLHFDGRGRLVLSESRDQRDRTVGVMYLADAGVKEHIRPLRKSAEPLPYQGFPFKEVTPYFILVSLDGNETGRASFIFYRGGGTGAYRIEHAVRFAGPQEERVQSADLYLDTNLTCLRYALSGKVYDKDREKVDVSYSREMVRGAGKLSWSAWVSNAGDKEEGGLKRGTLETADPVYVIDNHLFAGFAVIASQVPLTVGASHRVPLFHGGLNKAGFAVITVVERVQAGDEPLYRLDMVGFTGRYIMYVDAKQLLRRLVVPMDARGERSIAYDLVMPRRNGKPQEAAAGQQINR